MYKKAPVLELFFNKVADLGLQHYYRVTPVQVFSCALCKTFKSAFTSNRDEISSGDETCPGMKKFLFTCEFHPGMKRVEFHPGMKFNLKKNLSLSMMKT